MKRTAFLVLVAVLLGACNRDQPAETPAGAPAALAQPGVTDAAPPPAEIGGSCEQDCGGGRKASIVCAEGETPVCACAPTPNARCEPAPAAR